MSWKKNLFKEERIMRFGQTVDLPLFNQETSPQTPLLIKEREIRLPDWIWDGISIKAEVYESMKEKFAEDSLEYLKAIIELGGNATDHEVKLHFHDDEKWPLHIVSARRNYWKGHPFYIIEGYPDKMKLGPKQVKNTIWYVNFKKLKELMQ